MMYKNVDGTLQKIINLQDYLKENIPRIVRLTEAKLKENKIVFNKNDIIQRRDRFGKRGGGVTIMTRNKIKEMSAKILEKNNVITE